MLSAGVPAHGITKANYYYHLRHVREVCLENYPGEMPPQKIVPVAQEILLRGKNDNVSHTGMDRLAALIETINIYSIAVLFS